jgi:phosphodiesterase/alkaline phosphatase D-like protein
VRIVIVPHSCDRDAARLWLGAVDAAAPPGDFDLAIEGAAAVPVRQADWREVTAGGALAAGESQTFVQTVEARGLRAGARFVASVGETRARFSTLPDRLPAEGSVPFNVLLTSCFFIDRNRGLEVGAAVEGLPVNLRPDIKFLCGDQVYLDFPAFFVGIPFTEPGLGRAFLDKYRRNWSDLTGYQRLLAQGSSWFTADDHEFWNNFPNAATVISNTWTAGGRVRLKSAALPLFEDFQCERVGTAGRNRRFAVAPLSFFVADTRVNRLEGDDDFMRRQDLDEMLAWIRGLTGPGVLVIGQPVFDEPANFLAKRVVDRTLPNYKQYTELVRAMRDAKHSLLVLTGDVHFARVARVQFLQPSGSPQIVEVIASPSSLVAGSAPDPKAVRRFPPQSAGIPEARILDERGPVRAGDHFATLQFTGIGSRARVRVRHWYVRETSGAVPQQETTLDLI